MSHHDLIVIGAGNAGLSAARVAHEAGWSVLLVEARELGGTCPNRGCVPKKVLVAAAETLDVIARASVHGIDVGPTRLDWSALIKRTEGFVQGVDAEFEASLTARGISLVRGEARFVDRRIIEVAGERYEGRAVLVATGSKPRTLGLAGAQHLITSDDILSGARRPRSVIFVGAGVVAMELAHVLVRAGTGVTLLEAAPQPLSGLDSDAVGQLARRSRELGIEIRTAVNVRSIEAAGDDLEVHFEQAGQLQFLRAERVVNGAGRVANLDGLGLECAEVEFDNGQVRLDDALRSRTNPSIYFAGDALQGPPQLSPIASYEGQLVARNIIGLEQATPAYDQVPSVVFTIPALAQVGLTEVRATALGLDYEVRSHDMTTWRSARTHAEDAAYAKVLIDKASRRILGAHLLGHGSAETIHAFAFAMRQGLTAAALAEAPTAYPTFHSDLRYLL